MKRNIKFKYKDKILINRGFYRKQKGVICALSSGNNNEYLVSLSWMPGDTEWMDERNLIIDNRGFWARLLNL